MNAVHFLGSFFFDFRAIFRKRKPAKAASRAAAPAVIEWAVAAVEPPPVTRAPEAKVSAAVEYVPATEKARAPEKLRTLEEVRADVARLRAQSKARHAHMQAKWDTHFAPTDFQAPAAKIQAPAVARVPEAKPSAVFGQLPPTERPAAPKEFRTLEDMRADLAHLRATARERHAWMQGKHDISFAPTDFLDIPDLASPAHDKVEENFEATAYLDFVSLGARQPVVH
jgi:hypothetical protein